MSVIQFFLHIGIKKLQRQCSVSHESPVVFLAKPYNLKALRNAISQALESRKG